MRTPRRKRPNDFDLAKLKEARDALDGVLKGLYPATPEYVATEKAFMEILECVRLWTGNEFLWRGSDSAGRHGASNGWVKRPDHEKWPK